MRVLLVWVLETRFLCVALAVLELYVNQAGLELKSSTCLFLLSSGKVVDSRFFVPHAIVSSPSSPGSSEILPPGF